MTSDTATLVRTIIGLEIHVQLGTVTKMFCGCPVRVDAPPNSCVCPVCLGHPGALPVINAQAVRLGILTGLALNCKVAKRTKWDRKSYYYPDLPKNYQISQYDLPLAFDGFFEVPVDGATKRVRIRRAHLEEDAGKNLHDVPGCTLVDLNRTGTPLLEIVTEPDLSSPGEAYAFCSELQRLVTYLGVSEGSMQKGHMRFEPNVNLAIEHDGQCFHTPIAEIKNLNSFRSVRDAIAFESRRQRAEWESDHGYQRGTHPNENRGWNADRGVTEFQRTKEAAQDYRYFPDPDLAVVEVTDDMLSEARDRLTELPIDRRRRFVAELGLSADDAETIVMDRETADLFEESIVVGGSVEILAKQFVNVWMRLANDRSVSVVQLGIKAQAIAELATLVLDGTVSKTAANQLAHSMLEQADLITSSVDESSPSDEGLLLSPGELAKQLGLIQVTDSASTEAWVEQAFAANQKAVDDALASPKKAKAAGGFLRGQVMKISGGKADPKLVGKLIEQRLADLRSQS